MFRIFVSDNNIANVLKLKRLILTNSDKQINLSLNTLLFYITLTRKNYKNLNLMLYKKIIFIFAILKREMCENCLIIIFLFHMYYFPNFQLLKKVILYNLNC